jgi:hypothetical protein
LRPCARARGAINTGLVVVLVIVAVIALGFWGYKLMSQPKPPPAPAAPSGPPPMYMLACEACGKVTQLPKTDLDVVAQADGMYQCPKCHEFRAMVSRPGGSVIPVESP